jgi:hypothetical protein
MGRTGEQLVGNRIGHSTICILQAVKYSVCSGGDLIGDLMTMFVQVVTSLMTS